MYIVELFLKIKFSTLPCCQFDRIQLILNVLLTKEKSKLKSSLHTFTWMNHRHHNWLSAELLIFKPVSTGYKMQAKNPRLPGKNPSYIQSIISFALGTIISKIILQLFIFSPSCVALLPF